MNIQFLALAEKELDEAKEYYDIQYSGLGDQFLSEIGSALERIKQHPNAWHPLGKRTRRCQLKRFPYAVIYQVRGQGILVVAIMNLHRQPNYWQQRIKI